MSWSVSVGLVPNENFGIGALKEEALRQNPECGDQFDAAAAAAQSIIDSGVIGGEGKQFYVAMSGHANPGHEPRAGWANDAVTIQISQK